MFPIASSSEAAKRQQRLKARQRLGCARPPFRWLTARGLLGCNVGCRVANLSFLSMCSSVYEHYRKSIPNSQNPSERASSSRKGRSSRRRTVFPALSRPKNRILAFLLTADSVQNGEEIVSLKVVALALQAAKLQQPYPAQRTRERQRPSCRYC